MKKLKTLWFHVTFLFAYSVLLKGTNIQAKQNFWCYKKAKETDNYDLRNRALATHMEFEKLKQELMDEIDYHKSALKYANKYL